MSLIRELRRAFQERKRCTSFRYTLIMYRIGCEKAREVFFLPIVLLKDGTNPMFLWCWNHQITLTNASHLKKVSVYFWILICEIFWNISFLFYFTCLEKIIRSIVTNVCSKFFKNWFQNWFKIWFKNSFKNWLTIWFKNSFKNYWLKNSLKNWFKNCLNNYWLKNSLKNWLKNWFTNWLKNSLIQSDRPASNENKKKLKKT